MFSRKNLAAVAASAVIATGVVAAPAFAEETVDPDYSVATATQEAPEADSGQNVVNDEQAEKSEGSTGSVSELSSSDKGKTTEEKSEGSSAEDFLGVVGKVVKFILGILA